MLLLFRISLQLVEVLVHRLSGDHYPNRRRGSRDIQIRWNENEGQCEMEEASSDEELIVPHCVGCSEDPVRCEIVMLYYIVVIENE